MEAWETKQIFSCNNLQIDMKKQWAKGKSSLVSAASYAVAMHQDMHRACSKQAGISVQPEGQNNPSIVQAAPIQTSAPPPQLVAVSLRTPSGIMDHSLRLTN